MVLVRKNGMMIKVWRPDLIKAPEFSSILEPFAALLSKATTLLPDLELTSTHMGMKRGDYYVVCY